MVSIVYASITHCFWEKGAVLVGSSAAVEPERFG